MPRPAVAGLVLFSHPLPRVSSLRYQTKTPLAVARGARCPEWTFLEPLFSGLEVGRGTKHLNFYYLRPNFSGMAGKIVKHSGSGLKTV